MPPPDIMYGREQYFQDLHVLDELVVKREPGLWGGTAKEYRADLNLDQEFASLPRNSVIYDAGSSSIPRGADELQNHYRNLTFVAINREFLRYKGSPPRIRTIPSPIEEMDYTVKRMLQHQELFPADVIMCRKVLNMIGHKIQERVAPHVLMDWALEGLVNSIRSSGKVLVFEEFDDQSPWQDELYSYYEEVLKESLPQVRAEILPNHSGSKYMRLTHR